MKNGTILEDFLELVQIDAASGNERDVADAVKAKLEALGLTVQEDGAGSRFGGNTGNLLAVLDGGMPGSILLNAHMDRVAGGIGIKPRIEDDLIVSDGATILAADDLSGVAALIDSVRRLKGCGRKFPRVEYLFTVGEEAGLLGSKAFDMNRLRAKVGYAFDSPGRLGRIVCAAPGQVSLTVEVMGKAAHAGNCPEAGVNAAIALSKILATIRDGRLDAESTANFAVLDCGTKVTNIVQSYAVCRGEMRSHNAATMTAYVEYFERHCRETTAETGAEARTTVVPKYESFCLAENAPVIQASLAALRVMGVEAQVNGGGGGMDANVFNTAGIDVVGIATGYSDNHSVSERIVRDDLLRAGELAERIVLAWADRGDLPE